MKYRLQYRILSLQFRGIRPRLGFNGALIEHNGRQAVITNVRTPANKVADYLREINDREALAIRYQIIAINPSTGRRPHPPILFCHDFPKGTGVRLVPHGSGSTVALVRDGGRSFFSDRFKLGDVTNGRIESDQRVYQFHE